ncbi:leucyl aminopeptidase family protein [Phreatobacter aquaticus]|uniref:leucyl aminopeptidase family protein n=1 Tax=Phreatobacter aquaticus TaxID=2570229 RepID=UPI0037041B77
MHSLLRPAGTQGATPIYLVSQAGLGEFLALPEHAPHEAFLRAAQFEAKPGRAVYIPGGDGTIEAVYFGTEDPAARHHDPLFLGKLPAQLPSGTYRLANPPDDAMRAALAFVTAQYRFARYKKVTPKDASLVVPDGVDGEALSQQIHAIVLARDLVNTPANDLGPVELEAAVSDLARNHGAVMTTIVGDDLLLRNFPMIHAVGMGSPRLPRLIDLTWGNPSHPKVTVVGKGVCFDTGGLNLKPDASMLLMKKDMGGAAAAIGLAHMIMASKLPVRLRLLIAAVENSVSGRAFRPGDVYPTRKGITVEIGNTDAEGRLVLCDALTLADDEAPDLMVDFATLTGAARVALGADLAPIYTHDDALAADLVRQGIRVADPVWRLPLWAPYVAALDSRVADFNNVGTGGFAGSITAALFLDRFVEKAKAWVHADIYAWVPNEKPGRPVGGEMHGARAVFEVVKERFGG